MKILRSAVFRAACAIITGILLINNPDSTVHWITIAIGVMFLVSGVISCATYLNARKNAVGAELYDAEGRLIASPRPPFPLVGIGSILLGLILAIIPGVFVKSLMYVLGVLIILGAVNQFIALAGARRLFRVPVWFWVCPSLILVTGVFVMVKPMETASLPLLIIGWCLLFYGVTECINAVKIYRETKNELRVKSGLN
ncbi:MAG TPA: DUF308 domain-containing protein [Candidatus Prevotella stercoripullorum]|nr:DUF308 domain-containing protein [Candidatus Prevotella stercoripullorum]